jgi:hypothetical protein
MTDISEPGAFGLAGEAERLALITHEQIALVLEEAGIAEDEARAFSQDRARLRRAQSITIDWCTGQRAIFTDNVIPFPRTKFGKR